MPAARQHNTTANNFAQPGEQLTFESVLKAVDAANARLRAHQARQERALRALFKANGFDLDAGDMMFHAPSMTLDIPPRYAAQVRVNSLLDGSALWFMRNPKFSLF